MIIAGKVRANCLDYDICECEDCEEVFLEGTEACKGARIGLCCYEKEKIYIHCNLSLERKRKTLANELCHAYMEAYGMVKYSYTAEDVCNAMECFGYWIWDAVDGIYAKP